ncbi:MAG: butyrate kinase [Elusimicrobiaceae bacterium]|nr:butyrate kinase [Elusimicrobiaceae bacterium]
MDYNILVINPGSTSDDIGYYRGEKPVFEVTARYSVKDLAPYEGKNVTEQLPLRRQLILDYLANHKIPLEEIDAVIGRGGLLHALEGGVYAVNDAMIRDLETGHYGIHASNLGGILAQDIAARAHCPSFIADPVIVDEFEPVARYSGMPENPRISIFHALSQKRVARLIAEKLGKSYEDIDCIVCHGGGGVSVGAHHKGRVIDVTNGFEGDGPMTPQRSGSTPGAKLVHMCFSGQYTEREIRFKMQGKGGLVAYTGTSDVKELEEFIASGKKQPGSVITCSVEEAKLALEALIYQLSKAIGEMAVVLKGEVLFIALTGGLMHSRYIPQRISQYVGWIAPIYVFPGSEEKDALRVAACRALQHPEIVRQYS